MNQIASLNAVKIYLQKKAVMLDQIWLDHALIWQQLGWNVAQVKHWLACLSGINISITVLSGTPLARLRHKERWLTYCSALTDGLTVRASSKQFGIRKMGLMNIRQNTSKSYNAKRNKYFHLKNIREL
jgi:hypothetical protein